MFTGMVEELGAVRSIRPNAGGSRIEIECKVVLEDAQIGDSIAVNGCCLTVVERGDDWWSADAQVETLDRTTLGGLGVSDPVNLERPLRLSDRLGGHLVQGHVDDVGVVADREELADGSRRLTIEAPRQLRRYIVEKGSVTLDGVSLTVAALHDHGSSVRGFSVALIPHTLSVTTLGVRAPGDHVNLEVDVLAKYVERLVTSIPPIQSPNPGTEEP